MKKRKLLLLSTILAFLTWSSAMAQQESAVVRNQKDGNEFVFRSGKTSTSSFLSPDKGVRDAMRRAVASETVLYGNIIYDMAISSSQFGIYKFTASSGSVPEEVMADGSMFSAGCYDSSQNVYVAVRGKPGSSSISEIYVYNADTWEQQSILESTRSTVACEMTYNPVDGKIYGCFYSETTNYYRVGTLDYSTGEVTTIKEIDSQYYGLACNNAGSLYGIDGSGILYTIDTTTGDRTIVGSTGFTPYYVQSATFDMQTNKLYWFATNNTQSRLLEVNTTTAEVAEVVNWDSRLTEVIGAVSLSPACDPDAPAAPTNFIADYEGPALTGSISFTLPTTTYEGGTLAGELDYQLTDGNEVLKSGKANTGETVTFNNIEMTEGYHLLAVFASNEVGDGMKARNDKYFGYDILKTPTDIVAESADNGVVISWTPVTESKHNGYIGNVTYKIIRQSDGELIVDNLIESTYIDDTEIERYAQYYYDIIAVNDGKTESAAGSSNKLILGRGIDLPYISDFFDDNDRVLYQPYDANGDEISWLPRGAGYGYWYYRGSIDNDADDWLFSPKFNLEGGKYYEVSFTGQSTPSWNTEKLEVKYGLNTTVAAMSNILVSEISYQNSEAKTIKAYLYAATTGAYSIGFHCISEKNQYTLLFREFSITEGINEEAPDAAEVTVIPAEQGVLSADIEITAPSVVLGGEVLTSITKCIVRNLTTNTIVETKTDDLTPGGTFTVTDTAPLNGFNEYSVVFENEAGIGKIAYAKAYIGEDIPGMVGNLQFIQDGLDAVLTWDAPSDKGINGGYIDTSNLIYRIVLQRPDVVLIADAVPTCSYTDEQWNGQSGQRVLAYAVFAENNTGRGQGRVTESLLFGTPYTAPYKESFANKNISTAPWVNHGYNNSYAEWNMTALGSRPEMGPQDDDNGYAIFYPHSGGDQILYGPMVDLSGLERPALKFYYYKPAHTCSVVISTDQGVTWTKLFELATTSADWTHKTIDLSAYKDQTISFGFRTVTDADDYTEMGVDNIRVMNFYDTDLSLDAISCNERVIAGQTVPLQVKVTNAGAQAVSNYTVEISSEDKVLASKVITNELQPDAAAIFNIDVSILPENKTNIALTATVRANGDINEENDIKKMNIAVYVPRYPAPTELIGEGINNSMVLTWTKPVLKGEYQEIDNFEDWEPWSIGGISRSNNNWNGVIGNYWIYDGDQDNTNYLIYYPIPNYGSPMAGTIFNDSDPYDLSATTYLAHSGHQVYSFWNAMNEPSDDWLILPELGTNKTVGFWARSLSKNNNELYEMMVSTTGREISNFTAPGNIIEVPCGDIEDGERGYAYYEYNFDSDVKYVAIRYISEWMLALFIDDISYYPADGDYEHLVLAGYNIYRGGTKVNSEPITGETYTDMNILANESNEWAVTAVYTAGESVFSNRVIATNINEVVIVDGLIYGTTGSIIVENFKGTILVYDISGKLITQEAVQNSTRIDVAPGVYLVRGGERVVKVVVK